MGATVLENRFGSVYITISPAAVTSFASSTQTFTCAGMLTQMQILSVIKPTNQSGLIVGNARCANNGSIEIQFCNTTGASISPTASEQYNIQWMLPEGGPRSSCIGL